MEIEDLPHLQNLKYSLFLKRRFLPIFLATFLGAFNDNMLRSGLVVLIAYAYHNNIPLPAQPEILVTICSALLVVPMMLFASTAGSLADKYEKSRLVRYTKIAEVGIMLAAFWGFGNNSILPLMLLLMISGAHTTFYSPIKFSILPDHLNKGELLAGNGFMAGGSYLAVLLGLIAGGLLVELPGNAIGFTLLGVSLAGLVASLFIPASLISHPETRIDLNLWRATKSIVGFAREDRIVAASILGLSWYLLVGSVFMSQFANYAQGVVHGNNQVYILFLTVFSIGIAIGSLLCDTLLKGEISLRLTPYVLIGVSFFTYLMVAATPHPLGDDLSDAMTFLSEPWNWTILASMFMVALCGGIYMVPLYAVLQARTPAIYRSRVMAASNLSDALLMTVAALASAIILKMGFGILVLFLIVATLNLGVAWYARHFYV